MTRDPIPSTTLLTYAISTDPDPLQASPQTGDASLATLTVVASNSTHALIECDSISFGFLEGTNAKDFFSDSTGIGTSVPAGWSVKQTDSLFTATPDNSTAGQIGPDALTFILSKIKVNQQPGTTDMTITEVTSGSTTGTEVVPLAKFPVQFEVGDLNANPLIVDQGGSTTLSWSGSSGATYELQYEDANGNLVTVSHPLNEPDQPLPSTGSYTVENLQQTPTIFYLVVTLTVPGQDQPTVTQREVSVTVVAPQIMEFNAFPLTLGMGASCQLSWETNADQCFLDPGSQSVAAPNGSTSMTFNQTTDLTLTAMKGSAITQDTRTVTVVAPVIHSFAASTTGPINSGDPVTLTWQTQYASTVTIEPGLGTVAASGSQVVNPANTTTYILTCTGLGANVVQEVTVTVNPVQITAFTVEPTTINPGGSATLSWTAERATSASIDNGVGAVNASGGSVVVTPNPQRDTVYTLTCEGPNGPVSAQVTLGVNSVKVSADLRVGPNNQAVISWSTQNATSVTITKEGYNSPNNMPVALNGSLNDFVDMSNPTTFTVTAWGAGYSPVSASVTGDGGW